ncbi:hypothetical protein H6P81_001109 [Aristolochia fimbriata]|uniref:Uncharacterized protein n=1 Tax=Aristolochia fimbriata TaxID=158543 RepID=A0AAV7F9U4_ARIFI|nr:hypothetical protein H6P81_001109 [Aristolochia fimbriata]
MAPSALLPLLVSLLLSVALLTARVEGKPCGMGNVQIYQVPNGFGQGHIPEYVVQIVNAYDSPVHNVHVACGEFASARLVNPRVFKRLQPNDCLVNEGKPLEANTLLAFFYTNSRPYDLAVSSVEC